LQLGDPAGNTEGAVFGVGSLLLTALSAKETSGATYYDYFYHGYLQLYPGTTNGGDAILQSGGAPSNGDGGALTIQAGDASGAAHNGGNVLIESGAKAGSGVVGTITVKTGGSSGAGGGQMVLTQGLVVGSPTGGDKGSGTVNAEALYVQGSAVVSQTTGNFTLTLATGCTTTPTGTAYWTKTGNVVTLQWPTFSCTGNNTAGGIFSGVPSGIRPTGRGSSLSAVASVAVSDAGTFHGAVASVCPASGGCTAGQMLVSPVGALFSGAGTFNITGQTITYALD
jgi:hypothetical protein